MPLSLSWRILMLLTEGMTFTGSSDTLTKDIEAIQALVNTARVQAGSQYAAIESAVNYTTDLTCSIRAWLQHRQRCELLYGDGTFGKEPNPTAGRNCDACTGKLRSAGATAAD